MITQEDRNILRDVGREYILDIAVDSQVLKNKLTFKEHVGLCAFVTELSYEDVIGLTITESIKDFENKFKKFLKYGFAAIAAGVGGASYGAATGAAAGAGAAGVAGGVAVGVGGAIAGGLVAPALAMFALYLFRKLTDTCSRSCLTKFPLSTQRKICRYECQVNAARKMVNDLRSEITKCGHFANASKCERKLRKEYIKWSKRLQQNMIKLNQAKLGTEEKERKKRQKELAKKAKDIADGYQIPISKIVSIVSEDKKFRQNIPFRQHLRIYEAVVSIKEDDSLAVEPPKIDPKKQKWAIRAVYWGLWPMPIPFFNDVVKYMIKKYNYKCAAKCSTQKKFSQTLCNHQCNYLSAKHAVEFLKKELPKCDKANKPAKCKKKIYKMLEDWKQREIESKIKFQATLRSELRAAKERQGKV